MHLPWHVGLVLRSCALSFHLLVRHSRSSSAEGAAEPWERMCVQELRSLIWEAACWAQVSAPRPSPLEQHPSPCKKLHHVS